MTTEELSKLTLNFLSEDDYANAKESGALDESQLYLTPDESEDEPYRGLEAVTLYESSEGATNVELPESINNFKFVHVVIAVGGSAGRRETKVLLPDHNAFEVTYHVYNDTTFTWITGSFALSEDKKTIALEDGRLYDTTGWLGQYHVFPILKVVGYL